MADDEFVDVSESASLYPYNTSSPEEDLQFSNSSLDNDPSALPSEVLYVSTLIFLSILFLLGSFANTVLLMAFFRRPALRTTSNRFVVNLLVVNVLSSCLMLPLLCLDLSTSSVASEIASSIQCRLTEFVITWISSLSVFSTLAISFDQYLAILYPLRYQNLITKGRSWSLIFGSWILPFIVGTMCTSIQGEPGLAWETCGVEETLENTSGSYCWTCAIFPVLNFISVFLAPTIFITYIYIQIYTEARSNSKRTRRTSINPAEHMFNCAVTITSRLSSSPGKSKKSPDTKRGQQHHPLTANNGAASSNNGSLYTQTPPPIISSRSAQLKRSPSQQFMDNIKHKISNASQFMYREESRTAKISMVVIVLMGFCWGPFYIYLLGKGLRLGDERLFPYWTKCMVMGLACIYSVASPMVFAYRSKRLQNEVKKLFNFRSDDERNFLATSSSFGRRRRHLQQSQHFQQQQHLLQQERRSKSTPASPVQKKTSTSEDERSLLPPLLNTFGGPSRFPHRKMSTFAAPDIYDASTRSSISSASGTSSNATTTFHLESSERS